jgi:hypothetical protein
MNFIQKTYRKIIPVNIRFLITLYSRGNIPILVYQMGKVGSSSVTESLKHYDFHFVFQVHWMYPKNIASICREYLEKNRVPPDESLGEMFYQTIIRFKKKTKIITLVREPISRNMSAFFQNFKRFVGKDYGKANLILEKLTDTFINEYRHTVPLTWFDQEMKLTLGIDIFEYPFPKREGHLIIKKGNFELLVLKLETSDLVKEKIIADFLNIPDFHLVNTNVGKNKEYAQTYAEFIRSIKLPEGYIDIMCNSEYTQHFYTAEEIEKVRLQWRRRVTQEKLPSAIRQELLQASHRVIWES